MEGKESKRKKGTKAIIEAVSFFKVTVDQYGPFRYKSVKVKVLKRYRSSDSFLTFISESANR